MSRNTQNRSALLGLCIVLMSASLVLAAPATVLKVTVSGNTQTPTQTVLGHVKTRAGEPLNTKIVQDDQKSLLSTGKFETVVITTQNTPAGVIVAIAVTERPQIKTLTLLGNKAIASDSLTKDIGIKAGDPLSEPNIEAARLAIESRYKEEGFPLVRVGTDAAAKARGEVTYRIVEGPKVVVDDVVFNGNTFRSDTNLSFKSETKEKLWVLVSGVFNQEKLDRDAITLRQMHVDEGFLDCEVAAKVDYLNAAKTRCKVTFEIHEGPRYRVGTVTFKGNSIFPAADLKRRMILKTDGYFLADSLRKDTETIKDTYGELGHIYATVTAAKRYPAPTKAPAGTVNLVFTIGESDQFRVGRIRVKGNDTTHDNVILRECRFYPQQLYNGPAVKNSKNRLESLRLFRPGSVNITPVDSKQKGIKDMVVEVVEDRTLDLILGVGVSSNDGLMGNISLTQRNFDISKLWDANSWRHFTKPGTFKGAGETMSIVLEPGTVTSRATISWFTPYINDKPYSAGVSLFYNQRDQEDYEERRVGARASVGHVFRNRWYVEGAVRIENITLKSPASSAVEIKADDGSHSLLGLKARFVRDHTINEGRRPVSGDKFSFSIEQVVGTESFTKFEANYNKYWTVRTDALNRKHVVMVRGQYRAIAGDAPVFERYYAGGPGSVRGFAYRGISPRGHNGVGMVLSDAIGGKSSAVISAEYHIPLMTDKVTGVLFFDAGTVDANYALGDFRASVGFGLRVQVPMLGPVPMALDFGFPISKQGEDDKQLFSFTIGYSQ
ncbi:MAG: outer membrane protein assembly factor [Phycisphaerales bacterium]|nr:outer membrane protein assembly factor [Phycisphaerales bacterium]